MKDQAKIERIHEELKEAGMSSYGLLKIPVRHLPDLIQDDENIKGVVYGRMDKNFGSVMLIATTKRIIFLDYKPLFTNSDELTYDVVAGIQVSTVGMFAGVVLHTRVQDYSLKFVNIKCAEIFKNYIEKYLEKGSEFRDIKTFTKKTINSKTLNKSEPKEIQDRKVVLDTNTAILSTTDFIGNPHASVVHYLVDKEENYYFITKAESAKAKNINKNNNVAITIHHTDSLKSLLVKGPAVEVKETDVFKMVYKEIVRPRNYFEGNKLPPVTKLGLSSYAVFKIIPDSSKLQDFSIYNW
jgi:general stress protein 26